MTDETIVAVYDTDAQADAAVRDLKAADIPADAISRHTGKAPGAVAPAKKPGFWASLFGGEPDPDDAVYDRSLDSGSTVVTVTVSGQRAAMVSEILESHNPADLDERASPQQASGRQASGHGLPGTATREGAIGMAATNEGGSIRLSQEQMDVGKRTVNRGTTRVRRFVVETPVEEQITLRDETVTVERRTVPGGQPATDADFTGKTVEMTEADEEAVVGKSAHVTEEVVLRKEAAERVETVKDTVRREDVAIEKLPAAPDAKT